MKKGLILLFIILSCFAQNFAQNKGRLEGKVVDAKTKEDLPGVNVVIQGTYYGTVSDVKGQFSLNNVTPGTYTVKVSFIGYKNLQFTAVKIEPGKTKSLDVKMEESALTLDKDVIIIGEKPLVDVEETQSKRTISRDEIEMASVENISDLVVQQSGVVKSDNEIHIRGGRSYENALLLDGVSVQDPLSGTGFGLQLSSNSIEEVEVITGGFNAEFGQATSGVVNVKTREGGDKLHGFLSYKRDNFGNKSSEHVFNYDV
ncbi:MAG: carboxypeptidase-like regulatory domain-containing protein, partial [Methanococcaceae archaeon]